jgi:hypothetical protein
MTLSSVFRTGALSAYLSTILIEFFLSGFLDCLDMDTLLLVLETEMAYEMYYEFFDSSKSIGYSSILYMMLR